MTTTVKSFSAPNATDLLLAVNTYLASLTNPIIRKLDLFVSDVTFRVGVEYRIMLVTEDGGAALATPWVLSLINAQGNGALQTALQAAYAAHQAYFWGGPLFSVNDVDNGKIPRYTAAVLYNTTNNANALANYALR